MKKDLTEIKEIIEKKVRGKIVAAHDVFGHHYKFTESGLLMDSVTTVNILEKPHLVPWAVGLAIDWLSEDKRWERLNGPEREELIKAAKFQHTDVRDIAGTIGGLAHQAIEDYENEWIKTGLRPADIKTFIKSDCTDYRVFGAVRSAEAAFDKYKVVPVVSEILVGIPGVGAGTLDLIVMNDKGELELWDHKTSNNIDIFYSAQTIAYKKFFEHMTGLKIKTVRIMKLDKFSDRYKSYLVLKEKWKDSYDLFLSCSKVYKIREDYKKNPFIKEDKIIVKI